MQFTVSYLYIFLKGLHTWPASVSGDIQSLLEDACTLLDLKLAASGAGGVGGSTFSQYSAKLKQRSSLQAQLKAQQGYVILTEQLATYSILRNGEESESLQVLRREAAAARRKAYELVYKPH